jgi:hypothetical protein
LKPKSYPHLWSTSLSFETQVISTPLIHVIIVWNPNRIHTSDPRHYQLKYQSYPRLRSTSLSLETQVTAIPMTHVIIAWNFSHYPHFIPTSFTTSHTQKPSKEFYRKILNFNRDSIPSNYPFIGKAASGSHEAVK